jgi:transposase-like protein
VLGMVERKGKVAARVTRDVKAESVMPILKECILPESTVFTDEFSLYGDISRRDGMKYEHRRINHDQKIYVMGDVHTNTIEGFWSLVKRGVGGVYHAVSTKYLQSYLDEYSFRYNRRESGNLIFPAMLARVSELASPKPS